MTDKVKRDNMPKTSGGGLKAHRSFMYQELSVLTFSAPQLQLILILKSLFDKLHSKKQTKRALRAKSLSSGHNYYLHVDLMIIFSAVLFDIMLRYNMKPNTTIKIHHFYF